MGMGLSKVLGWLLRTLAMVAAAATATASSVRRASSDFLAAVMRPI